MTTEVLVNGKWVRPTKVLVNGKLVWLVDLSSGDWRMGDFVWQFTTRKEALRFLERVKAGTPAREAYLMMD